MKILTVFCLIFSAVYRSAYSSNHMDISPYSECMGQPDGIRLPGPTCNHFILCESQTGLTLTCRSSEPHFNSCEQRCVNNPLICGVTTCDGDLAITTPLVTTTTAPLVTTTTAPLVTTTTTRFIPPTVPVNCPVPCSDLAHTCSCSQQWRCINAICQCDPNIQCFITRAQCLADSQCGGTNGCPERCECIDDNSCICNRNAQCPLNILQCNARCGCRANCDCVQGNLRCFCHENCACSETQDCPFTPSECLTFCTCNNQCVCNGNMCKCDPAMIC